MKLSDLKRDDKGIITKVLGRGPFRKRIIEMGFVQGQEVEAVRSAPLGDPVYYKGWAIMFLLAKVMQSWWKL